MMKWLILTAMPLALAGCGDGISFKPKEVAPPVQAAVPTPDPAPAVAAAPVRKPPTAARTAAQFDATTAEERAQAAAPAKPAGEKSLGSTVASLGDPARVGFWLETPLVTAAGKGRVVYNGKSANVDLIPIAGPATAGSRISLSAMRLIEAPLTDLPTLEVFADG